MGLTRTATFTLDDMAAVYPTTENTRHDMFHINTSITSKTHTNTTNNKETQPF